MKRCVPLALLSLAFAPLTQPVPVRAQTAAPQDTAQPTLSVLHVLTTADGTNPNTLTVGADSGLYGTAFLGGVENGGTVFKITQGGVFHKLAVLYQKNGYQPFGPLLLMSGGGLMGTAYTGGKADTGALFLLTPPHRFQTKHEFADVRPDASGNERINDRGAHPAGTLVLGPDGAVYGTTVSGGVKGNGVAYRWTAARGVEVLHDFLDTGTGYIPVGLTPGPDGALYGITEGGGAHGYGTIFRLTMSGTFTLLHSFTGTDGDRPGRPLVSGPDGALYGFSNSGGQYGKGTVFRIMPDGTFTLLYTFSGGVDGSEPSGLTVGPDGDLYGTTYRGGSEQAGYGVIFRMTRDGVLTILYNFRHSRDGARPNSGVTFGLDGALYGSTTNGSTYNNGAIFKLHLP